MMEDFSISKSNSYVSHSLPPYDEWSCHLNKIKESPFLGWCHIEKYDQEW